MRVDDQEMAGPIILPSQRARARNVTEHLDATKPLNDAGLGERIRMGSERAKPRSPIAAAMLDCVDFSTQGGVIKALELAALLAAAEPYAARTLCMAAKTASDVLDKNNGSFPW